MDTFWRDLHYGLRSLARAPGFTLVAVLTLALGIGANTAMFSVINAVLLSPLPYKDPGRIVRFRQNQSWPDMQDLASQSRTIADFGGYVKGDLDYTGGPTPERLEGAAVTGGFFGLLGAKAGWGRLFLPEEDKPGGEHLVVLSHGFWQTRLGGRDDIIGQTVSFSGIPYSVVGIMPPGFQLPQDRIDVWTLLQPEYYEAARERGVHFLRAFGRLEDGATLAQARAEMQALTELFARLHPEDNADIVFEPVPLQEYTVRNVRRALLVLFAAVGFVLLIVCANVANLFLTQSLARRKEMAVRAALGASRWQLVRQLLTESVALALLGGAVGLVVALWVKDILTSLAAGRIPRLGEVGLDATVLFFTLGVSLFSVLLFGAVPAFYAARPDLHQALKEGGQSSAGTASRKFRSLLVVGEVALALLLLTGAGLLLRSFYRLQSVDLGFSPESLLTANFNLPTKSYRDIDKRIAFFQQVLERVEALPGVEAVAATTELPLGTNFIDHDFVIEGRPPVKPGATFDFFYRGVTPGYFRTIGIPLLRGRLFTPQDRRGSPDVIIINQTLARQFFPDTDPLGQRVRLAYADQVNWLRIVGVVGDVRSFSVAEKDAPAVYVPFTQERNWWRTWMNLVVRTKVEPMSLAEAVQAEVTQVDGSIPVADIRTLEQRRTGSLTDQRFQLFLLGLFASLALLLAAVGLYGVLSNITAQRTHEIGIRMTLGARPGDILRLVVSQGMLLAAVGIAAGVASSLALTRLMSSLLFETQPTDPLTYAFTSALLALVALVACWLPARRATRVDPMVALRYE